MAELQPITPGFNAEFLSGDENPRAEAKQDISMMGALLLSATSVVMSIFGMVFLASVLIGCWWLVSHIPVPAAVRHLMALLHL